MINIKFLEDENGNYQVADLIEDIINYSHTDDNYGELSARIYQVMNHILNVGVPPKHLRTLTGQSREGNIITLTDVVKELDNHPPLLEFRVNWKPIGAFRAIFFYQKDSNENQTIYFTKAVIKPKTYAADFESAARESERMMKAFINKL